MSGTVRRSVRGGRASFVAHLQIAAQYRANMAVWAASSLIQVVVYLSIWRAVAQSSGGAVSGYSPGAFAGYFLVMLLVRDLTFTWVPWHFPDKVRTGELSPMLLRPLHPLVDVWGDIAAYRLQGTVMLVPVAIVLGLVFHAEVHPSPAGLVAGIILLPFASAVRFLADALLSLSSFWLTRIDGIRGLYMMFLLLLSGQFAPLQVFPQPLRVLARALPFYWTLGYPVELLTGRRGVQDAPLGLLVLVAWTLLLWLGIRVAWKRGAARYSAVGA